MEQLETLLKEFIDEGIGQIDPDFESLPDLITDTGGAGLCFEVSMALRKWLEQHDIWSACIFTTLNAQESDRVLPDDYPCLDAGHWVLLASVNRTLVYIDMTGRQFDETLPFPYVWDAEATDRR